MKKLKIGLIACLACLALACCVALAACGPTEPEKQTYKLTWQPDTHVTAIVAEGYDELPTELEDGTEVTFTVTTEAGYEVSSVSPVTIKKDGEKYKLTVTRDTTIKVITKKVITKIEVTKPETLVYYAGETIDLTEYKVTVYYQVGDPVETEDYAVKYQKGEAFSLGDTKFEISYGGKTEEITLDQAVVGKITLDLNGGKLSAGELAKLPGATESEGKVIWTFTEANAEDITLPTPVLPVGEEGKEVEFPFLKWTGTGIENNKIPAKTEVSLTAIAAYETTLIELESIQLTTKKVTEDDKEVTAPYLVMKGEFKAATQVYLFLFEGNVGKLVEGEFKSAPVYLNGTEVTKATDSNAFELEFDLRNLSAAEIPEGSLNNKNDKKPIDSYAGLWMDIKLCTTIGGKTLTQEIDLNNYAKDFIVGSESVKVLYDTDFYEFSYQKWTPTAGDVNTGDGSIYDGTEVLLKVNYTKSEAPEYYFGTTTLEIRDNKPYVVIPGYAVTLKTKEEVETALTGYIKDMQNFSNWNGQTITQTLNVNEDDLTFEILIGLENVTVNGDYIMHTQSGNFNPSDYDRTVEIQWGSCTYTFSSTDPHKWNWSWTGVHVVNAKAVTAGASALSVEGEGEAAKLYLTIEYTTAFYTVEEIKALEALVNFDLQTNDNINGGGWDRHRFDNITFTVDETNLTFTVKIDISSLTDEYGYTAHLSFDKPAEGTKDAGDLKPNGVDSFTGPEVEFGGKIYQLHFTKGSGDGKEYWGCLGLEISAKTEAPETPAE